MCGGGACSLDGYNGLRLALSMASCSAELREALGRSGARATAFVPGAAGGGMQQGGAMQYRIDPKRGTRLSALGLGCMRFPAKAPGRPDSRRRRRLLHAPMSAASITSILPICIRATRLAWALLLNIWAFATRCFLPPSFLTPRAGGLRTLTGSSLSSCAGSKRITSITTSCTTSRVLPSGSAWLRWGVEDWIARQKAAGRIGAIGFSYMGARGDFPIMLDAYDGDFCQIQYNYANERYQAGTAGLKEAARRGLAVFVMEPLLGGRLAGKLPDAAQRVLAEAADEHLSVPASWGLAWVWDHPEVTMLLSGMASPSRWMKTARVAAWAEPGVLTPEQHERIARVVAIFEQSNRVPCTGCNYCMPCPQGINIPGCFSAYNASLRMDGLRAWPSISLPLPSGAGVRAWRATACTVALASGIVRSILIYQRGWKTVQHRLTPGLWARCWRSWHVAEIRGGC